ncbi:sugar phosphate isomerase/epimerase family protein [Microbacterium ulmi]|uniref:Sugar phosphate isomerase/epimerase n=1 Tax=Microbacterium ulmi TaxID=179095 RepID=A0A7Y2M1P4_9MICO|nr:sugar phosphate isomerase/epimerase family protein [Microbacterium ulmi]NII68280.1 sugar phosphate isomerase/epimerase [Microbacterium ulmi]NNH04876.1 sugar phosphate isomerase/epimerase [Microbacterium ulmi]
MTQHTFTAENWPIAATTLSFSGVTTSGVSVQDAGEDVWGAAMAEIAHEGFTEVDITDSWIKPGDLTASRLEALKSVAHDEGLTIEAISAIRRSVIDPLAWEDNLAYSHRTIDAAVALGCSVVSVGLHRPLLEAQQRALWFWTADGPSDPTDQETWQLAVTRLRDLGDHASSVGIGLSLEMYEDTLIGTADSAVRLVEDIGHSSVGLNPDLGNLHRLHRPVEPFLDSVAKCVPYANYWHVKGYSRIEDSTNGTIMTAPVPMEASTMNYRAAIKMALQAGFSGAFCTEHYGGDGLAVSARNRDYIRRLLAFDLSDAFSPEVVR